MSSEASSTLCAQTNERPACWVATGDRGLKVLSGPDRIVPMHIKFPVNFLVITERLGRLLSWRTFQNGDRREPVEEPPLRADLFNPDQLERHARALATSHQLATGMAPDRLIPRLAENERLLVH